MKYKSLGEEGDIYLENTIAKQIKEPVDNTKGRHFKTPLNIAESYDGSGRLILLTIADSPFKYINTVDRILYSILLQYLDRVLRNLPQCSSL
jgi:hypothetical protein